MPASGSPLPSTRKAWHPPGAGVVLDTNRSLRSVVQELLRQAEDRDASSPRRACTSTVLKHLVGATLDIVLSSGPREHKSFAAADAAMSRQGDFELGNAVLHVTDFPREAVIAHCQESLDRGLHPILITLARRTSLASHLAEDAGIKDQLEVFDIEHFLVVNLHVWRRFMAENLRLALGRLIARYNEIVDGAETDPSLKIRFRRTA